jgi:integrase
VIKGIGRTDPGTHLRRLIREAGLAVWPKPWHNLRASLARGWAQEFPAHVAAAWLGHSSQIANEHYLIVREEQYQRALPQGAETHAWELNTC